MMVLANPSDTYALGNSTIDENKSFLKWYVFSLIANMAIARDRMHGHKRRQLEQVYTVSFRRFPMNKDICVSLKI